MIETLIAVGSFAIGGAIAYGDLRAKIGKLEGQMQLISQNLTVIMNNNKKQEV